MENSTEQFYNLFQRYLIPILKFANIYVDDHGILRPFGQDPKLSYQEEGRELVIVETQARYIEVKSKKEDYQIFNPFSVPKQTVFLANMVMTAANEKDDYKGKELIEGLVYDDDLDMWIPKDGTDPNTDIVNTGCIKMFEKRDKDYPINTIITFSHTDMSGNPQDEIAKFSHMNIIMATIGALINLIKKFQKSITPDFISTEIAVMEIEKYISKIQTLREKEKKQKPQRLEINNLEDIEELYDDIAEIDKIGYFIDPYISIDSFFLPEDKRKEYDPAFAESKINRNIILPNYKEIRKDDDIIQTLIDINEVDQYIGVDFIL